MNRVRCARCLADSTVFQDQILGWVRTVIQHAASVHILCREKILIFPRLNDDYPNGVVGLVGNHYLCGLGRYEILTDNKPPELVEADSQELHDSAAMVMGLPPASVVRDLLEDAAQSRPSRVFRPSPGAHFVRRVVPRDDPKLLEHHADLMKTQPADAVVVEDANGTYRWQQSGLVRWLDAIHCLPLNDMAVAFGEGKFSLEEYMDLYRGLGYSLSGFEEVFGDRLGL